MRCISTDATSLAQYSQIAGHMSLPNSCRASVNSDTAVSLHA